MKDYIEFVFESVLFVDIWRVSEYIEIALNPKNILLLE